jgi:pimeloyl-ACP methyl ester carboxylesterase
VSGRREITFPSHGETCAAWHLVGEGDAFAGELGRPCVVMAHGFGATRDSGLLPFAEAFAEAGLDVLLFDYRCFGESSGEPRQLAWPPRHREDYRSAVECARGLAGVDPKRIVLWGTSWSGGHVVYVAAEDPAIAALIAQTPDLDGIRTLRQIGEYAGAGQQLRVTLAGLKDAFRMLRGQEPLMIPTVAPPGELGGMTSEESEPGMNAIAGPTWVNEVTARASFAEWGNRAITKMEELRCPILIQIADRDSVAPAAAARAAAWRAKGRVEVREYPCAHFDIYLDWRERAIADQLHFLRRHLATSTASIDGGPPESERATAAS